VDEWIPVRHAFRRDLAKLSQYSLTPDHAISPNGLGADLARLRSTTKTNS